jgi:hypothetical protein
MRWVKSILNVCLSLVIGQLLYFAVFGVVAAYYDGASHWGTTAWKLIWLGCMAIVVWQRHVWNMRHRSASNLVASLPDIVQWPTRRER